jgi:hypothetical protein
MVASPVVQEKRCIATVHRTASLRCTAVANGHSETIRATPGGNAGHGRDEDDTPEPRCSRIERGDTRPEFSSSDNYFDAWHSRRLVFKIVVQSVKGHLMRGMIVCYEKRFSMPRWATSAFEAQHPIVRHVPRTVAFPADVVEKKYLAGKAAG